MLHYEVLEKDNELIVEDKQFKCKAQILCTASASSFWLVNAETLAPRKAVGSKLTAQIFHYLFFGYSTLPSGLVIGTK